MLETIVRFVGNVGSSIATTAIAPTTLLETFALEVLLLGTAEEIEELPDNIDLADYV
mgnify:CR=1 FL=1